MLSQEEFQRNEFREIVIYIFMAITFPLIIPLFLGFAFTGFEESFIRGASLEFGSFLVNFLIYIGFTIATLGLVIFPIARLITIRKGEHPATQDNPTLFRIFTVSFLFAPENGLIYKLFDGLGLKGNKNPMRFFRSFIRIMVWSMLFFGALGIAQIAFPQLQVVGIPQIQVQQVSPTTEILFTSLVPAWSETMMILFVLFFLMGLSAYLISKFIKDDELGLILFFAFGILVASSLISISWGGLHRIVYGGSEIKFFATLVFGYLGSVMTILSGTFVPFFVWHVMNNLFASLAQRVPINEDIIFISGLIWFLFFFLVIAGEIITFRIRRKKGGKVPEESI